MRPTLNPASPTGPMAHAPAQDQSYSPYLLWIIWLFWLFFLVQPVDALLAAPPSLAKALSLLGMALFFVLYFWITWQNAWRLTRATPTSESASRWREWGPIAALLALAIAMTLAEGQSALGSLIYVSAALCARLETWRAVLGALGLTLLGVALAAVKDIPLSASAQIFFIIPAVGSFVYFFGHAIRTNQELRRARQEIARLAVSEERLRFARDLHDLLGHTLSLIALKSELARRLVSAAPEQATSEIGDIETAARQALTEVREAVAAYRLPTLPGELRGAGELLAAAGIAYRQRGEAPPLAPAAEATLAWAVREGVTNVIRHSHARVCDITLSVEGEGDGQRACLEVLDDGVVAAGASTATIATGAPVIQSASGGSGLAGLRERVATLGGACESGPAPAGGWRLLVTAPLTTGQASAAGAHTTNASQREERRVTAWFR